MIRTDFTPKTSLADMTDWSRQNTAGNLANQAALWNLNRAPVLAQQADAQFAQKQTEFTQGQQDRERQGQFVALVKGGMNPREAALQTGMNMSPAQLASLDQVYGQMEEKKAQKEREAKQLEAARNYGTSMGLEQSAGNIAASEEGLMPKPSTRGTMGGYFDPALYDVAVAGGDVGGATKYAMEANKLRQEQEGKERLKGMGGTAAKPISTSMPERLKAEMAAWRAGGAEAVAALPWQKGLPSWTDEDAATAQNILNMKQYPGDVALGAALGMPNYAGDVARGKSARAGLVQVLVPDPVTGQLTTAYIDIGAIQNKVEAQGGAEPTPIAPRNVLKPLPETVSSAMSSMRSLDRDLAIVESAMQKAGRFSGNAAKLQAWLGTDPEAAAAQAAINRMRVDAQATIKGIPSNYDAQLLSSTLIDLGEPETTGREKLKRLRDTMQKISGVAMQNYGGAKGYEIPPDFVEWQSTIKSPIEGAAAQRKAEYPPAAGEDEDFYKQFKVKGVK